MAFKRFHSDSSDEACQALSTSKAHVLTRFSLGSPSTLYARSAFMDLVNFKLFYIELGSLSKVVGMLNEFDLIYSPKCVDAPTTH